MEDELMKDNLIPDENGYITCHCGQKLKADRMPNNLIDHKTKPNHRTQLEAKLRKLALQGKLSLRSSARASSPRASSPSASSQRASSPRAYSPNPNNMIAQLRNEIDALRQQHQQQLDRIVMTNNQSRQQAQNAFNRERDDYIKKLGSLEREKQKLNNNVSRLIRENQGCRATVDNVTNEWTTSIAQERVRSRDALEKAQRDCEEMLRREKENAVKECAELSQQWISEVHSAYINNKDHPSFYPSSPSSSSSSSSAASQSDERRPIRSLAGGWHEYIDPDTQIPYFWNENTNAVQWEDPTSSSWSSPDGKAEAKFSSSSSSSLDDVDNDIRQKVPLKRQSSASSSSSSAASSADKPGWLSDIAKGGFNLKRVEKVDKEVEQTDLQKKMEARRKAMREDESDSEWDFGKRRSSTSSKRSKSKKSARKSKSSRKSSRKVSKKSSRKSSRKSKKSARTSRKSVRKSSRKSISKKVSRKSVRRSSSRKLRK